MNGEDPLLTASIYKSIWDVSPNPDAPYSYKILQQLTKRLLKVYESEGFLQEDPFVETAKRQVAIRNPEIIKLLKGTTCLVTGGLGCVGSALIKKLLDLEVEKIIVVDKKINKYNTEDDRIIYSQVNISNSQHLNEAFDIFQPDYVFHTAAQRDPGYAETQPYETIRDNIIGTKNVADACENSRSVKQCVFSSTGKASRYFTNEVYAATKKIGEYIFDTYAKNSNVKYSVVRFTHILENSLMNAELQNIEQVDYLAVHSPGKYVTAQNVSEAVHLMLNALLSAKSNVCNFSIVRHLAWPVESLEVALYHINKSKSKIPIVFKGNPPGYHEKFFRGQMDWSKPAELNLLINVYENKTTDLNEEKDIIIFHIPSIDKYTLERSLSKIQHIKDDPSLKACLSRELKNMVQASLKYVNKNDTLKIMEWGLDPKTLAAEKSTIDDYSDIALLLRQSLENSAITVDL